MLLWLCFALAVGGIASRRGRSSIGWVVISIVISPVLGFILVMVLPPLEKMPSSRDRTFAAVEAALERGDVSAFEDVGFYARMYEMWAKDGLMKARTKEAKEATKAAAKARARAGKLQEDADRAPEAKAERARERAAAAAARVTRLEAEAERAAARAATAKEANQTLRALIKSERIRDYFWRWWDRGCPGLWKGIGYVFLRFVLGVALVVFVVLVCGVILMKVAGV